MPTAWQKHAQNTTDEEEHYPTEVLHFFRNASLCPQTVFEQSTSFTSNKPDLARELLRTKGDRMRRLPPVYLWLVETF